MNASNFIKGEDKYFHFILLAKDDIGHKQIRELSTRAWMRSYKTGTMTRVPTYYYDLKEIIRINKGHVIGSTACLGGYLPNLILKYKQDLIDYSEIVNWCNQMIDIFGKDNFYLELQPSDNVEQVIVNQTMYELSKDLNIPYIITTDSHYLKKDEKNIHKAFLKAQEGDREVDEFYSSTYLMGTEELEGYFKYFTQAQLDKAYENILKIKNECVDYTLLKPLKIPSLTWRKPLGTEVKPIYIENIPSLTKFINSDFDGDRLLAQMISDKLDSDRRLINEETYKEIEINLDSTWRSSEVNKAHWSAYFLNLQKIIDVCWESGTLVGPGRGSGVGFILLYLLDIIQINPLWETTKCFPWRFLNPERVSVLDIDTDIEGGRRAQTIQALRDFYGEENVANVVTFGTEKSKSAIQTAARGLGIDVDEAAYLSSLIPADRGQLRTLKECYYGDEEKGFLPIYAFRQEMEYNYPELWKVAQKIEGLICRVGEHAGGVIFVDEPFTDSTALMRVPNGDIVTQFDLHDCEDASLIKIDLLSVECLDKIHNCLDLLQEYKYIEPKNTLKETYESVIGIYNLEREDEKMWKMVWEHKIQSLFQMEKQSGIQGIALIKPKNINDLAVLNSMIRLMATEKGGEQPLNTWARYRKDIKQWYKEMRDYGLNQDDINWLSQHSAITDGVCESQEGLMSLVQEDRLGGNSLTFADKCRKGIAKKQGKLFEECEETYYRTINEKGLNKVLAHYVWDVLLKVQRGYSFNRSHCLAYSLIALQEMNLCFRFPIIFWNTACLITDSGDEGSGTDYNKIASAIGKMQKENIAVNLLDINRSNYKFSPNVETNEIMFGLKGVLNIGDDVVQSIIENRPYNNPRDFLNKVKPNKQAMISLIKGGAFDKMMDRELCMAWYIWETCDKKSRITLQNLNGLMSRNMLPEDTQERITARRIYEFTRFLKAICLTKDKKYYKLNDRAINFLNEMNYENLYNLENNEAIMLPSTWDKVYQKWMDVFRNWIAEDKETILNNLNTAIFKEDWNKYAQGNLSSWEMEALCFYYHEHELAKINKEKYGISNYKDLPVNPEVERVINIRDKTINIYKIQKICGTCIAKNKTKSSFTILTPDNSVVEVKATKEFFSMFDKQISVRNEKGEKKIAEKSWFNRGSMVIVQGIKSEEGFRLKKYSATPGHLLYKINKINNDGTLELLTERIKGESEEGED